jgi:uridine monophosphate synthetase
VNVSKNLSYQQRAQYTHHPLAQRLFHLMNDKKTNLALSADVTTKDELLTLADQLGSQICILKTHIDIIEDFDSSLPKQLQELACKHQFLLFEDRKFADIGNTVQLQYTAGIYKIVDWADIINAHGLPGPGIVQGLKAAGVKKHRGLLLLAEMSSAGNFFNAEYIQATLDLAMQNKDFVIGFIAQRKLHADPAFIYLTPGVSMAQAQDKLGQGYLHPHTVIAENLSDVIIVGRSIYQQESPFLVAQHYRKAGWAAYLERCGKLIETSSD